MSRAVKFYSTAAATILSLAITSTTNATWSIVIADTKTGEVAIGTVTCLDNFDLLAIVPVVVVGKGAAAVQSAGDFDGIRRPIIFDSLLAGVPPENILAIVAGVADHQQRQYGIADTLGRTVTFSGSQNSQWKGGVTGTDGSMVYAIQGNILSGGCVVPAIEQAILTTVGDISAKLMAGMQAAGANGGDGRCSCTTGSPTSCGCPPVAFTKPGHIGGMVVARIGDIDDAVCNASGCADGDYFMRLNVPFQDPANVNPVIQLQDLFDAFRASLVGSPDAIQTVVVFEPSGPLAEGASTTMRITPNDWQGLPHDRVDLGFTVKHAPGSNAISNIGAVVNNGDGSFSVVLTSNTTSPGTDRFRITINGGPRQITLMPEPVLELLGPMPTDACASAPTILEGSFPVSTLGATTDGPDEPALCDFSGDTQVASDVWACYLSTFAGPVTATLCDSDYNTKIAVYLGCTCPAVSSAIACDDDACGAGLQSEVSFNVNVDQEYLIRIGGFGGAQGTGSLTITRHLEACCLPDGPCQNLRAEDCLTAGGTPQGEGTSCAATLCPPTRPQPELIVNSAGTMVVSAKSRFLSFAAGEAGRFQAVRVTLVDLPPPYDAWNGVKLFAQKPVVVSGATSDDNSVHSPVGEVTFIVPLGCAPFFRDWSTLGTIHVFHEGIVPSKLVLGGGAIEFLAAYEVQLVDISADVSVEANFGPPLTLTTAGWADMVELFQREFVAPDNSVSVFDTLATLAAFTGQPSAPARVRVDLVGVTTGRVPTVDGVISVNDLVEVIAAFSGGQYPFSPGPVPCP